MIDQPLTPHLRTVLRDNIVDRARQLTELPAEELDRLDDDTLYRLNTELENAVESIGHRRHLAVTGTELPDSLQGTEYVAQYLADTTTAATDPRRTARALAEVARHAGLAAEHAATTTTALATGQARQAQVYAGAAAAHARFAQEDAAEVQAAGADPAALTAAHRHAAAAACAALTATERATALAAARLTD